MSPQRGIHWLGPTNILLPFFIAVALAVGHHCYYAGLAGQPAPDGEYIIWRFTRSKQQYNIAVGTAFAFLFKAGVAWAVTTSYVQLFWHVLRTSSKATRLVDVDVAYSLLHDMLGFFSTATWRRQYLMLTPIAVIFW